MPVLPSLPLPPAAPGPVLARAGLLWSRQLGAFTALALLQWVPAEILMRRGQADPVRAFLLVNTFLVVAGALVEGAITLGALQRAAGRPIGPGQMLGLGSERFLRALAVNVLCAGLVLGGLLLLPQVPLLMILARTVTFTALPVALAELELPIPEVFRRTWELGRGRRGWLLFLVAGFTALELAPDLWLRGALGALPGAPAWAAPLAMAAVESLTTGFVLSAAVATYLAFAASPPPQPAGLGG